MTEVERLRAALEEIRGVKLLTDCGIHPMRAAGIRHAFEITAEIATKALSGEPTDSGHETDGCAACDRGVLAPHDVESPSNGKGDL